ncbi:MAG: acyl-CoA dehydrogenase family protein [Aliidongia sp.]
MAGRPPALRADSWSGTDPEFSRKMGARGWIGMTWPKRYGGHERSALERYVVLEEMLAAGAPVGSHWVADRQSGPLLLRLGTEAQRQQILPRIADGECYFCIGMSEPDSGSDLASVRTRAVAVPGGYQVNGTKLCDLRRALLPLHDPVLPDRRCGGRPAWRHQPVPGRSQGDRRRHHPPGAGPVRRSIISTKSCSRMLSCRKMR